MQLRATRRIGLTGSLVACLLLAGVASSFAQNLGEAARQERARKKNEPHRAKHVYTEDDLKRPQILLRQDRERAEAAREHSASPAVGQTAEVPGTVTKPAEIPLGDIARHYRLLKQIRERQELGQAPQLLGSPPLAAPAFSKPPRIESPALLDRAETPSLAAEPATIDGVEGARRVRVRRGDSLWKIARRHVRRGARWQEVAAANPQLSDPARIRVGEWIRLPLSMSAAQSAKQFRVRKGDSMWKLAQAKFGSGLAWSCIAQANPQIQNASLIYPGQTLTIPDRCTATP